MIHPARRPRRNPGLDFREVRDTVASPDPVRRPTGRGAAPSSSEGHFELMQAAHNAGLGSVTDLMLYHSPLRPFFGLRIAGLTPITERWGAAAAPLDPETVIKFELVPYGMAMGWFIFDASQRLNMPVELTRAAMPEDGFDVRALFLNPRGLWQLSHFSDGLGPTGHEEWGSPAELLRDAHQSGYIFWNPGSVDAVRLEPWW